MTEPSGARSAPGGRTLVVACGALARELLQVVEVNGLDHVDVECLPASYHNTPDVIPDAVAERVRSAADRYERIFVGYGDCGTGGRLDAVCAELDVERLPGDHCYEHFDRLVVQAFWLDTHPELRSQVFANYRRLVYLAQTDDPDLVERARAAAARLELDFELRRTGLGDLEASIVALGRHGDQRTGREPDAVAVASAGPTPAEGR